MWWELTNCYDEVKYFKISMGAITLLVKTVNNFENLGKNWKIDWQRIRFWIKYVLIIFEKLISCFAGKANHERSLYWWKWNLLFVLNWHMTLRQLCFIVIAGQPHDLNLMCQLGFVFFWSHYCIFYLSTTSNNFYSIFLYLFYLCSHLLAHLKF